MNCATRVEAIEAHDKTQKTKGGDTSLGRRRYVKESINKFLGGIGEDGKSSVRGSSFDHTHHQHAMGPLGSGHHSRASRLSPNLATGTPSKICHVCDRVCREWTNLVIQANTPEDEGLQLSKDSLIPYQQCIQDCLNISPKIARTTLRLMGSEKSPPITKAA